MWAIDYPHPDHPATWVHDLKRFADRLEPDTRRRVLGQNTEDIYRLGWVGRGSRQALAPRELPRAPRR